MATSSKKPGVAFWAAVVVVVVLVVYPLSFGPACWITSRTDRYLGIQNANRAASAISVFYRPLTWAMTPDRHSPFLPPKPETMINRAAKWYARIGARDDHYWVPTYEMGEIDEPSFVGWGWHRFSYHIPPSSAPRVQYVGSHQSFESVKRQLQKHPDD